MIRTRRRDLPGKGSCRCWRALVDTTLYDLAGRKTCRIHEWAGEYQHSAGGKAVHEGLTVPGCDVPAHLFYLFDLQDPQMFIQIPGIRWLPIYYTFRNESGFDYRVVSDKQIEILSTTYLPSALKYR